MPAAIIYNWVITEDDHLEADKILKYTKDRFSNTTAPANMWFKWVVNLLWRQHMHTFDHLNPNGYLRFGPYWYALKDIFMQNGKGDFSHSYADTPIAKAFCGKTDEHTIVLADKFFNSYGHKFFPGHDEFYVGEKLVLDPYFADESQYLVEDYYFKLCYDILNYITFE